MSEKILIVDADANAAIFMKKFFKAKGFFVETAPDGYEALDILEHTVFNLLIIAANLSKMSALELIERIALMASHIEIIIVADPSEMKSTIPALKKRNVFTCFSKPLAWDETLIIMAKKACERQRLRTAYRNNKRKLAVVEQTIDELHQIVFKQKEHVVSAKRLVSTLSQTVSMDEALERFFEALLEQNEYIINVNRLIAELSRTVLVNEALEKFSHALEHAIGFKKFILILHDKTGDVRFLKTAGIERTFSKPDLDAFKKNNIPLNPRQTMLPHDGSEHATVMSGILNEIFDTTFIIPLKGKTDIIGILITEDPGGDGRDRLGILLPQTAVFLENRMLYEEMAAINRELVTANERLKNIDRQKSDFLNMVAHDLRTPLTSIRSYSELLLMYRDEPSEVQEEFLNTINRECVRLTHLLNDFLDLARIEAGTIRYEVKPFNLRDSIDHFMSVYEGEAGRRRIALSSEIPSDLPKVTGDPDRIAQVLSNLMSNAVKFTPDGGTISVKAAIKPRPVHRHREIEISVTDTGPGISPRYHRMIFDKFGRIEKNAKAKGGTGLGLAIAKNIVEYHGGRIWVESEPEKGSTFFFTLPLLSVYPGGENGRE